MDYVKKVTTTKNCTFSYVVSSEKYIYLFPDQFTWGLIRCAMRSSPEPSNLRLSNFSVQSFTLSGHLTLHSPSTSPTPPNQPKGPSPTFSPLHMISPIHLQPHVPPFPTSPHPRTVFRCLSHFEIRTSIFFLKIFHDLSSQTDFFNNKKNAANFLCLSNRPFSTFCPSSTSSTQFHFSPQHRVGKVFFFFIPDFWGYKFVGIFCKLQQFSTATKLRKSQIC